MFAAYDSAAPPEVNHLAVSTAAERLQEIGAVTATLDDEDGAVVIHVGELLGGVGFIGGLLLNALASAHSLDPIVVIDHMR
jgi:hypothetical protein